MPRPGPATSRWTARSAAAATRRPARADEPGGRLIGLDVDPIELPRTEARLRAPGFGPEFRGPARQLRRAAAAARRRGTHGADVILADLGVSSMQFDNPDRGFTYKGAGPLDMRMNPSRGEPASQLIARLSEEQLAVPRGERRRAPRDVIAGLLKRQPLETTHAAERLVRDGLDRRAASRDEAGREDVGPPHVSGAAHRGERRVRGAGGAAAGPAAVPSPGGRVAVLTFHSGEDRRVKKSFQAGMREGVYSSVNDEVERASREEFTPTLGPRPRSCAGPCAGG